MTHLPLAVDGTYVHEPYTKNGMSYGRYTVLATFPKTKRPSKGWHRHARILKRMKHESR